MFVSLIPAGFAKANVSDKNAQLLQAAYDGNFPTVQTFLANGADVNARNRYGATSLLLATFKGHTAIIKLLLENGADINAKMKCPLITLLPPRRIPKEGADLDSAVRMSEGETALIIASTEGHTEIVRLLIEKGADIKAIDTFDRTALIMAAASGWTEIVKILLENGADINAKDDTGDTALMWAVNQPETIKLLLENGADVNAKEIFQGETALMMATTHGQIEVVKLLLEKGANINEKNFKGGTSLMLAAGRGETEIVELLLERGAEVNARDKNGLTALQSAKKAPNIFSSRSKKIIELLEKAGAKE
jgi:ankyrin repeat protein